VEQGSRKEHEDKENYAETSFIISAIRLVLQLFPWSGSMLEMLKVAQIVKFPAFNGT
jgi:hypothetical protein